LRAGALSIAALGLALTGGVLLASRREVRAGREARREQAIESALVDGFSELSSSRYAAAKVEFERVLALDADNVEARFGRIIVSLRSGQDAQALALLQDEPRTFAYDGLRALASKRPAPAEDPAWLESATATELAIDGWRQYIDAQGRRRSERVACMRKVLERFDEAILRSPRARPTHHQMRALAASLCKDAGATRSACAALIALWPDSARVLYCAGSSLDFVDLDRALQLLERSVALDPNYAPAFQSLGTCYLRSGRREEARVAYQRAVEIDPRDVHATVGVAMTLDPNDCADEMRALLRSAIDIDPSCIDAWGVLGALGQMRDEPEEAAAALYRILELDPAQTASRRLLAQMLLKLGDTGAAREQWEIAMAQSEPGAELWVEYAQLLLECGAAADALEALDVARGFGAAHASLDALEEHARAMLESASPDGDR
jgi:Tfp pilus assembly protein PilF